MTQKIHRAALKDAKRIVVKAGSKVLVHESGHPDTQQLSDLVTEIAALQNSGHEVSFVSSGAVGAGLAALGIATRPSATADLQMAAAVGQTHLMSAYNQLFTENGCKVGQVLLTHDALENRERHLNARNTLLNLIAHDIIPIINENDAVSSEEIKFGDNDVLAALVAILIGADALVLLSTTDGLRDTDKNRVSYIEEVDNDILGLVADKLDNLSTGGMASKLQSAQIAAHNGIPVVIANGRKKGALTRIFKGEDEGSLLFPKESNMSKRKTWIAFFNRAEGEIIVDAGATKALREGNSLLPVGIRHISGTFGAGAMVDIKSEDGTTIARGLVEYSSEEILVIFNKTQTEPTNVTIHRDNMVIL